MVLIQCTIRNGKPIKPTVTRNEPLMARTVNANKFYWAISQVLFVLNNKLTNTAIHIYMD